MPEEKITEIEMLLASYENQLRELQRWPPKAFDNAAARHRAFIELVRSLPTEQQRSLLEAALDPHVQALEPKDAAEKFFSELIDTSTAQIELDEYTDLREILELTNTRVAFLRLTITEQEKEGAGAAVKAGFDKDVIIARLATGFGTFLVIHDLQQLITGITLIIWMTGGASLAAAVPTLLLSALPNLFALRSKYRRNEPPEPRVERRAEARELLVGAIIDEHTILRDLSKSGMGFLSDLPPPQVGSAIPLVYREKSYRCEVRWSSKLGENHYRFGGVII